MKLGLEVGLDPGYIVLDGDPASPSQKGHTPQFLANVCCGQTAGWIKMPLGMEVGLGPGDIVLDGDPVLPPPEKKGHSTPNFGPRLLWSNGWMDQEFKMKRGMEVDLGSGHIVLDGDPAGPQSQGE